MKTDNCSLSYTTRYPEETVYHELNTLLYYGQTEFQEITIATLPSGAKLLGIDGEIQSTSDNMDAFNCSFIPNNSDTINHSPEFNIDQPTILIVGAGAGGPAKFALRNYPNCKIIQIDLDSEMIQLAKVYLHEWHEGSFDDNRVTTQIANAIDIDNLLQLNNGEKYDLIIFDLTHDTPQSKGLWSRDYFEELQTKLLKKGGILSTHLGWTGHLQQEYNHLLPENFNYVYLIEEPISEWRFLHLHNYSG